jgi:hypothetical protein
MDPDSTISTGVRLKVTEYARAHAAARAAGLSLAGYIAELINHDEIDEETGRPIWAAEPGVMPQLDLDELNEIKERIA